MANSIFLAVRCWQVYEEAKFNIFLDISQENAFREQQYFSFVADLVGQSYVEDYEKYKEQNRFNT